MIGSDIPSLNIFGILTLESIIRAAGHRAFADPDCTEIPDTIKNADPPDNDRDGDCSAKLSDVFINFGGDLREEFHSTLGQVDNLDATISENAVYYTSATAANSTYNIRHHLHPHLSPY